MSEFEQDKEYQSVRQGYQQAADELPPQSLDAHILKAAHEAVEKTNVTPIMGMDTQPVKRAWYVPVSYVAILVVSLSVVMKLAFEPTSQIESPVYSEMDELAQHESLAGMSVASIEQSRKQAAPEEKTQRSEPEQVSILARKRSEINSSESQQMMADVAVPPVSAPPAPAAPVPAVSSLAAPSRLKAVQPLAEMAASSAEPALQAQISGVAQLEKEESVELERKAWAEKLQQLFKQRKFEALKAELKRYRSRYPIDQGEAILSDELLAWEKHNMPVKSQNP